MIATTHFLIGATIGKVTGNIYLTIPFAFVSHYVLDLIPHWNVSAVKKYRKEGLMGVDKIDLFKKSVEPIFGIMLIAILLVLLRGRGMIWLLIAGAFWGVLPDILYFFNWKYKIRFEPIFLQKIHDTGRRIAFKAGLIPQVILIIGTIIVILK